MPKLCPSTYIPSNISHSRNEIELIFENTSEQLLNVYKEKMSYDMVLRFNRKDWPVHVYVIEQHSDIFWKGLVKKQAQSYHFDINVNSNESSINQLFQKVLQCLYGRRVSIYRCQVQKMYKICKALHLAELLDIFHTDILMNSQEYEIFPLLQLANEQKIIDIISMCYEHLECQHFQQIRYSKSGLLLCEPDLFKSILKKHNFLKFQRGSDNYGVGSWEIKSLIEDYCIVNGIKGRRKDRFFQEIQNRNLLTNSIAPQANINFSPAKRIYTCTKMVSMTSLKDITQPQEEDNRTYGGTKKKSKISKCVSFAQDNPYRRSLRLESNENLSPLLLKAVKTHVNSISDESAEQKNSVSQCSLSPRHHLAKQKQSLNSSLNFLISDPKTVSTITILSSNLLTSLKSSTQTEKKASNLINSLKHILKKSRQRTSRIESMESELDEIWAEMKTGKERLGQIEKVVNDIKRREKRKDQLQKRRQKRLIETSLQLDLTVSTEFGARYMRRPY